MGIPTRLVVPYFVRTRTLVTLMCYQIISFFVLASCLIAPVSGHNTHTTDVVSHAPAPVPTSENAHSAPYSTPFSYESDILITDRQPHLMKTTTKPVSFAAKMAMCVAAGVAAVVLLVLSLDQQSVQKQQMLAADRDYNMHSGDQDMPAMPKDIAKYKTQMCKNYSPKNPLSCKFGARCIFAHSPNELRSLPKDADVIEPRVEPTRRAWRLTGEISADQVSAKTHKIAKGPDGSNGFDNSNSHGRRALLRLRSLH